MSHDGHKSKKKSFKPKHQKSKLFRASEPLLSVLMWGVNHTISELNHVNIPVMLMPDDFKAHSKVKVDRHYYMKENMPSHFKVKEYCPLVFRNLRERFRMDDQEYIKSLTKSQPLRSGGKLYMSYDHRLLLKVLTSDEVENMHHLLKEYHPYIVERHGETLLPQYLGMYRLTVEGTETYLVVMRNIFSSVLKVHVKYDLKGSTVDREASEKEKASKELPTLKDNDFVKDGVKLYLKPDDKKRFLDSLTADTDFLAKANIMDYSLCLGMRYLDQEDEEAGCLSADEAGGEESTSEPELEAASDNDLIDPSRDIYALMSSEEAPQKVLYFIGIVDVLTQFGLRKRTAQAAKSVKHGREAEISTVHPEQYAKRFQEFISKAIESP